MEKIYYKKSSTICKNVYDFIKENVKKDTRIQHLLEIGHEFLQKSIKQNTEEKVDIAVAIPICISLNNCVGYENDLEKIIKETDIVNIELGISSNGCIVVFSQSFCVNKKDVNVKKIKSILNNLQKHILKNIKHGETNDEVKILTESKCIDKGVFLLENCISHEQFPCKLNLDESKYIVLNYKKYYDKHENLLTLNECFEFEKDEVYTINISIAEVDDCVLEYKTPVIYRFNENRYNLKLQSSREFLSKVKNIYKEYAFDIRKYNSPRERMGIKECIDNNILEPFQKMYVTKNKIPQRVFTKKFTIMVDTENSILL